MEMMERVLNGLDGQVENMLAAWNLPGVSVAIVKDGKVVMAREEQT